MEGQRCEDRLLFPACPGEPPSPRGRSGSPTRGEEPCERLALLEESVCIKPSGLHLHMGLCCLLSFTSVLAIPPGWQETRWCLSLSMGI